MDNLNFELLCIDSRGDTVIKSEQNLLHRIIGNGTLWKKPLKTKNHITDDELGIKYPKIIATGFQAKNTSV